MKRQTIILTGLLSLLLVLPAGAQIPEPNESQNFDGGLPADWLEFETRHPESSVDYGWDDGSGADYVTVNTIGDGPGWAGGIFTRNELDNSFFGDVTIGEFTLDDELHATGRVVFDEMAGYNAGIHIGFMDAGDVLQDRLDDPTVNETPDFMGFIVLEQERVGHEDSFQAFRDSVSLEDLVATAGD